MPEARGWRSGHSQVISMTCRAGARPGTEASETLEGVSPTHYVILDLCLQISRVFSVILTTQLWFLVNVIHIYVLFHIRAPDQPALGNLRQ